LIFLFPVCKKTDVVATIGAKQKTQTMKKLGFLFSLLMIFSQFSIAGEIHKYAAFEVEVSGTGKPLFLIPGASCSGDVWDSTVPACRNSTSAMSLPWPVMREWNPWKILRIFLPSKMRSCNTSAT
jgi:hypothetical protein